MFAEFLVQNEFFERYIQLFTTRFTIGNLEMEDSKTKVTTPSRALEMYSNMDAFLNLIKENPDRISPYDLIEVAYTINKGEYPKGYRKTQVDVKCAKHFFPISARNVPEAIYSLFNAYHNIWSDLDIYEREARFHIELVRIQPFEDGNKRTARIITNYNLCKNNKAPIVIGGEQTDEYFRCIDEYDVEALTELFRKNSKEELDVMMDLYKQICGDKIIPVKGINNKEDMAISSLVNEVKEENLSSNTTDLSNVHKLQYLKED